MRKQAFAIASLLLLCVMAAGHAYGQGVALKAKIPFEFAVGDQKLPAGEYRVEHLRPGSLALVLVRRADGRDSATAFTVSTNAKGSPDRSKLVFNHYGDQYFLSQIWTEGDDIGQKILPSRRETEMASRQGRDEVALLAR